jgi:pimeloyl-ACP methyl ester carboxylesterase
MKKLLIALGALLVLGTGAFFYLDRSSNGIVGFYAWKALSGKLVAEERADLNGISLYYETYGAGTPVLVLHGGTAFIETMHNQITALAQDHLVIAPDSRAHGRSTDAEGEPLTYALMADDMIALMDQLAIERADIVGWSDGGNIGLDMAIRYPSRVRRLVTYGSNFHFNGTSGEISDAPDPEAEQWAPMRDFYTSVAPQPEIWPIFLAKVLEMWRAYPTYAEADLGQIETPTLVMAGEFDSIRDDHTRSMAAAIPGASLIIVEGQDHYAPLMAPETVTPHIVDFLN